MNQYETCQLVQKWFLVCWGVDSLKVAILLNHMTFRKPAQCKVITLQHPVNQDNVIYDVVCLRVLRCTHETIMFTLLTRLVSLPLLLTLTVGDDTVTYVDKRRIFCNMFQVVFACVL